MSKTVNTESKKKTGQATAFRRFRRPEKNWCVNPKGDRRQNELAPDDSNLVLALCKIIMNQSYTISKTKVLEAISIY